MDKSRVKAESFLREERLSIRACQENAFNLEYRACMSNLSRVVGELCEVEDADGLKALSEDLKNLKPPFPPKALNAVLQKYRHPELGDAVRRVHAAPYGDFTSSTDVIPLNEHTMLTTVRSKPVMGAILTLALAGLSARDFVTLRDVPRPSENTVVAAENGHHFVSAFMHENSDPIEILQKIQSLEIDGKPALTEDAQRQVDEYVLAIQEMNNAQTIKDGNSNSKKWGAICAGLAALAAIYTCVSFSYYKEAQRDIASAIKDKIIRTIDDKLNQGPTKA